MSRAGQIRLCSVKNSPATFLLFGRREGAVSELHDQWGKEKRSKDQQDDEKVEQIDPQEAILQSVYENPPSPVRPFHR